MIFIQAGLHLSLQLYRRAELTEQESNKLIIKDITSHRLVDLMILYLYLF